MHYSVGMTTEDFYGRKSTKDDGRSVASQEDDWRADVAERDVTAGRVFADPESSASRYTTKPRPDYLALLAHITAGDCEQLALWEASRGSRDLGEWVSLLDLCRRQDVKIRVVSHERTYDIRKRRDWRTLADEGVNAADETEMLSDRVRRGQRSAAAKGSPAGKLPYGYVREYDERGKFKAQVPHPEQAPVVAEMVEWLAARVPLAKVARRLNQRGVTTPTGKAWTARHVRHLVLSPTLIGRRVHQGKDVGPAVWPAIVDEALWRKAVASLTADGRKTHRSNVLRHWLSGAARCSLCGGVFRPLQGARSRRYSCRGCHRVSCNAEHLEGFVEEMLMERLRRADAAGDALPVPDDAALRAAIHVEDELTRRMEEHYAESAAGKISAAGVSAVEARLLPQIEEARAKVKRLSLPPALADLDGVDIPGTWPDIPVHLQRDVLLAYAEVVVAPATRAGSGFDPWRLAGSRWAGDALTWGEHWTARGLPARADR